MSYISKSRRDDIFFALGIEVESPERGTSEDLERKARPEGERHKKMQEFRKQECGNFSLLRYFATCLPTGRFTVKKAFVQRFIAD